MTPAERQQLKRDRRKAGLVLVQEWVPAQAEASVRAAITDTLRPSAGSPDHPCAELPHPG